MSSAPSWYAHPNDWVGPVPGLPPFVTLPWIEQSHDLSLNALKLIHPAVKAGDGIKAPAWWPAALPVAVDIPYLLAMAMGDPAFFASLLRVHVKHSTLRPTSHRPTLFGQLQALLNHGDDESIDANFHLFTFVDFLEIPDETAQDILALEDDHWERFPDRFAPGTSGGDLLAWLERHFPDTAAYIEARTPSRPPVETPGSAPAAGIPDAAAHAEASNTNVPQDEEEAALVAAARESLVETHELAAKALAEPFPSNDAATVLLAAAVKASFRAGKLDAFLKAPVDIGALLRLLDPVATAIAAVGKSEPVRIPAAPYLVDRPTAAGLKPLVERLTTGTSDISGLRRQTQERALALTADADLDIVTELGELRNQLIRRTTAMKLELAKALDLIEAGKAEPVPVPVAEPEPVEPAVERAPPAEPARAPVTAEVRPAAPAPIPSREPIASGEHFACANLDLGAHSPDTYDVALGLCLGHLREFLSSEGPEVATFALGGHGSASVAYGIEVGEATDKAWASIARMPDPSSPDRTWTLELSLATMNDRLVLSVRVSTASPNGSYAGRRVVPSIVSTTLTVTEVYDARRVIDGSVIELSSRDEFDALVLTGKRTLPVVAVSLDTKGEGPSMSHAEVARRLAGVAHVATVTDALSRELSDKHGRNWSLYNRAVRVYLPGANTASDDHGRHVKFNADTISAMARSVAAGEGTPFEDMICDLVVDKSRTFVGPTFDEVDAKAAEDAVHDVEVTAGTSPDVVALKEAHHREMEAANRRIAELQAAYEASQDNCSRIAREHDDMFTQVNVQRSRADGFQAALKAKVPPPAAMVAPADPKTVEELCVFAENELGLGVYVMPCAIRELAKARNVNIERVHKALVCIRDFYVPFRLGEISREKLDHELKKFGFIESKCKGDPNKMHHTVPWGDRKVTLDRHVKWGMGTSLTSMIRIYFFWDEEKHQVIIGHMPTHLPD